MIPKQNTHPKVGSFSIISCYMQKDWKLKFLSMVERILSSFSPYFYNIYPNNIYLRYTFPPNKFRIVSSNKKEHKILQNKFMPTLDACCSEAENLRYLSALRLLDLQMPPVGPTQDILLLEAKDKWHFPFHLQKLCETEVTSALVAGPETGSERVGKLHGTQ